MDADLMSALARIEEKVDRLLAAKSAPTESVSVSGDPIVRMDQKKWTGPSMKGEPMSACPSEGLTMYAGLLDWFADKNASEGKAQEAAKDRALAAKAREWASKPRTTTEPVTDELPF